MSLADKSLPRLTPIRAMFESVKEDPSLDGLHITFSLVTSRVIVRPLLEFLPVSTHPILPVPGPYFLTQIGVSRRIICVAHDVLSEAVKTVIDVRKVQALGLSVMHFGERRP